MLAMMLALQQALAGFNTAPGADVEAALLACCASPQWARQVAAGRPYPSADALYEAADDALTALAEDEFDAALNGHPRIGERAGSASSRREQSGEATSSEQTLAALVEGNRDYEERFGHVYLVCAEGRSGDELLNILRDRLRNDADTERAIAREELRKINRIRLARLIGDPA
jgi:2-oxo-4-hydroxy-4-carboxy-5-ureidoimidazoline decarboxylase